MKRFLPLAFLSLFVSVTMAQEASPSPSPEQMRRGIWKAELPGGTYIVALSGINSISMHDYIVDGAARVTEVNINTVGSQLVRFYYIEPNTPQLPGGVGQSAVDLIKEKAEAAISRGGADEVWQKVVKNYPTTTHARTVEYRLASKESLQKLFTSVQDAWLNRKAATFKP